MKCRAAYPVVLAGMFAGTPALTDWASVYVNETTGGYWYVIGSNPQRAALEARQLCYDATNNSTDCEIIMPMRFTSDCAAIVLAGNRYFGEEGNTIADATDAALALCKDETGQSCQLEHAFCAQE